VIYRPSSRQLEIPTARFAIAFDRDRDSSARRREEGTLLGETRSFIFVRLLVFTIVIFRIIWLAPVAQAPLGIRRRRLNCWFFQPQELQIVGCSLDRVTLHSTVSTLYWLYLSSLPFQVNNCPRSTDSYPDRARFI